MSEDHSIPEDKIDRLLDFKDVVKRWDTSYEERDRDYTDDLRGVINREIKWVRQQVIEAGCFKLMSVVPPAIVGGPVLRNGDLFDLMFTQPYGVSITSHVIDMIDQTIGVLRNPDALDSPAEPEIEISIQKGYAFIAMAIDPALVDTLDSIKEVANRCDIQAERVDEDLSGRRITDVILESIAKAEVVFVDLTESRPNVYYEAGYAHGLGKKIIYIAKEGTTVEFDLKDYPVVFFKNQRELKKELEARLQSSMDQDSTAD